MISTFLIINFWSEAYLWDPILKRENPHSLFSVLLVPVCLVPDQSCSRFVYKIHVNILCETETKVSR